MANITSSFTQLLPVEDFVSGISTNKTGSYTYNGPETFDVWVDDATGYVIKIDVSINPPQSGYSRKTINAKDSSQLPMAYALSHQFVENYSWTHTYTDVTMSNGDVFKKMDNPDLRDVYVVKWNKVNSSWSLDQIIKPTKNDNRDEAIRRRDYVKTYGDQYSFGTDVDTKIEHYIAGIGTYLGNNPYHETWKYVTLPDSVGTIPKIPAVIQIELQKVSVSGVGGNV
tara:strand:+ start:1764 stop:2441 length:678 start_codon:yes stop_codon:yes gene_type:complete